MAGTKFSELCNGQEVESPMVDGVIIELDDETQMALVDGGAEYECPIWMPAWSIKVIKDVDEDTIKKIVEEAESGMGK